MLRLALAATLLLAVPALAQQPKPNEALNERISTRLGALIIQNEALTLQIEQLQARVKELEAAAPKPAEPPKN